MAKRKTTKREIQWEIDVSSDGGRWTTLVCLPTRSEARKEARKYCNNCRLPTRIVKVTREWRQQEGVAA